MFVYKEYTYNVEIQMCNLLSFIFFSGMILFEAKKEGKDA